MFPAMLEADAKSTFLAQLTEQASTTELRRIKTAYTLSQVAHQGQMRDDGSRFFDHPKAVAEIIIGELQIYDSEALIAALLHDTLEDTWLKSPCLYRYLFGSWVASAIVTLTKRPGHNYLEGLHAADWRTLLVKLADRLHNVRTLEACDPGKQQRKLQETRQEYLPLVILLVHRAPADYRKQLETLETKLLDAMRALAN